MTPALRALVLEAIERFAQTGYDSAPDLEQWLLLLHAALERELPTDWDLRESLSKTLHQIYAREVERLGVRRRVPGVNRYTLANIEPHLRAELDRRILAGVDLIKLNRRAAVDKTLRRFSGWVTSMPSGGGPAERVRDVAQEILKPTKQVRYEARRVATDQGHKLSAAVASVVALQEGAVAAIWHDRGEHDRGYNARPEHLARSGKLFLVRDSWAIEQGLIKRGALAYTDDFEAPAQLPYCSCYYEYVTSPGRLPSNLLTRRGEFWARGE